MNTSEKANNMLIRTGLPQAGLLALCILKAQVVTNSRMLSSAVASPCQTFRELLAWRPHTNSQADQLAVLRMRRSPKICTSFSFFMFLITLQFVI